MSVGAAQVYGGVREGAVEGYVRRVAGGIDGTQESLDTFADLVGQLAEQETRRAASTTVEENVERAAKTRAGRKVRYARVPTSFVPCEWCAMLASRGFVYRSTESAEAASHHHCTCTIVPGVKGSTEVAGYDTAHYKDVWKHRERYEIPGAPELMGEAEGVRSELKTARKAAAEEEKERRRVAALSDEAKVVFESKQFVDTFGAATATRMESSIDDAMNSGDSRRINAAKLLSKDIKDGFEVESVTTGGSKYLTSVDRVQFDADGAQSPRAIAHELAHRRDYQSTLSYTASKITHDGIADVTLTTSAGSWSTMSFEYANRTLASRFKANRDGVTPAWRDLKRRLGVRNDAEVMTKIIEANPDIADHRNDYEGLSDIIHAASNGKQRISAGHFFRTDVDGRVIRDIRGNPVPYWDDTTRVIEPWADYSASLVVNEREAALIQWLFPEETAIMDAMMEVMVQ